MEEHYNDMFHNKTKEEIILEISELRKNIKKKHRALKRDMLDTTEFLEMQLKPISEPLRKLVSESENYQPSQELKQEVPLVHRKRKLESNNDEDSETPVKRYVPLPLQGQKRKKKVNLPTIPGYESDYDYDDGNAELPQSKRINIPQNENMDTEEGALEDEEMVIEPGTSDPGSGFSQPATVYESPMSGQDLLRTPRGRNLAKEYVEREFKGRIAKEYFVKLISDTKTIDNTYGVRVDGNNWMIGNKVLEIDNNDLIIDGIRYQGTRGLYELIFMKHPSDYVYDELDLQNYAYIITRTNAHRTNYSSIGRVKSSKGYKYKHIISKLEDYLPRENPVINDPMTLYPGTSGTMGNGLTLTDTKPSVIYYDDVNELVDRLKILVASKESGNTGLDNEINAIFEELNELNNFNSI